MNSSKIISKILYYICRILGIAYLVIGIYSTFSIITKWSYIEKEGGRNFAVCLPFTNTPILNGENNIGYMLFSFIFPMLFYGLFFYVMSNVFRLFNLPKLFTTKAVRQLEWFYWLNITVPWILILLASIFYGKIEEGFDMLAVVHFILGGFAYFIAKIFSQGVKLQNDQDLII
jgi:hypothetical protein